MNHQIEAIHGRAEARPSRKRPIRQPVFEAGNNSPIIFLTVCTNKRVNLLDNPNAHKLLVQAWMNADSWNAGRCVIMPDHIHLFCSPAHLNNPPLARWVQYWKALVSKKWSIDEEKPIWQKSFWDTQLRKHQSYSEKWAYIRNNPVRAGLSKAPDAWPYQGELNKLIWRD